MRCQPITVAGLTIARAPRQSGQKLQIRAQNQRSGGYSRGRGVFRFSTASCWRIAKLSKYEAANVRSSRCRRATRSRMSIFRMAERLSGRWPVSQGFCGVRSFGEPHLVVATGEHGAGHGGVRAGPCVGLGRTGDGQHADREIMCPGEARVDCHRGTLSL